MLDSRTRWPIAIILLSLTSGCSAHDLTRAEGNGGWSDSKRQDELRNRLHQAGVAPLSEPSTLPETPPTESLDLPRALELAARKNRPIAVAQTQVDAARARVADARGRLLPATIVSGRYTWFTDPQTTQVQLSREIIEQFNVNSEVTIRARDFGVVNGSVTLPLDITGEILATLRAAQAGYRGERARLWATTLAQEARVVRAYLQLLEAQQLKAVAEQTLAVDRAHMINAKSRFDGGRVTKNELLVAQVAVLDAEQRLLQRTQAIDVARWELNDAVGIDVNAQTTLDDVPYVPQLPEAYDAIQLAWQSNPAIVAVMEEQQRLESIVTALERSRFPRFSAGGAGDYTSSTVSEPQAFGSGFVGFTLDLGTDTRREAQIAEARAAADRSREGFELELRELETAIRRTQQAVVERLRAYAAAQSAVAQAQENLRIRQQQFNVGRAESSDVLGAEALLASQRATVATARYQAYARRAELQQLMGLPMTDLWDREEGSRDQEIKGSRGESRLSDPRSDSSSKTRSLDPGIPRSLSSLE